MSQVELASLYALLVQNHTNTLCMGDAAIWNGMYVFTIHI
jgi:hypothetical protein